MSRPESFFEEEFDVEINQLANQYLLKNEIAPLDYKWSMLFDQIVDENQIDVFPHEFKRYKKGGLSGMLVKDDLGISITYNPKDYPRRQNFTKCHELIHFLKHSDLHNEYYVFKDMSFGYGEEADGIEMEANKGASIMMLPDITIIKYLETTVSFPTMAEKLEMTQAALYVRMVQFMSTKVGLTNDYSRNLVNDFRYNGRRDAINRQLEGWGSTIKKQIILDYENAL